jgi:hypothetical protein
MRNKTGAIACKNTQKTQKLSEQQQTESLTTTPTSTGQHSKSCDYLL